MSRSSISYEDVIKTLSRTLVSDPTYRVKGPTDGYRCKATYSLQPTLITSSLTNSLVNELCERVDAFVKHHSAAAAAHPKFFCEVCGKVTRKGEYMVKLVLLNEVSSKNGNIQEETRISGDSSATANNHNNNTNTTSSATLYDEWMQTDEPVKLVAFVREAFPTLVSLVVHVRLQEHALPISTKPDKSCAYVALPTSGGSSIIEYTPNGIPFCMSADSFCEVNQPMEDAIYEATVEYLRLLGSQRPPRRAFICGRDVNSVVKTFSSFYDGVTSATTCPCVYADTKINELTNCHFIRKDQLSELLRQHVSCEVDKEEMHLLVTAGRHGLHPSTCHEIVQLSHSRQLTDLIYVSCNVESFARDFYILKEALRIANIRTFDFFPGTDYVMTLVHWRPISAEPSRGRLLVLPVGPPCVGKSTCGRGLQDFFNQSSLAAAPECGPSDNLRKRQRKSKEDHQKGPLIPRHFAEVQSNVVLTVLERDEAFHAAREKGLGLKHAKAAVHDQMLTVLTTEAAAAQAPSITGSHGCWRRPVVYLDSTNGSADARALYTRLWQQQQDNDEGRSQHNHDVVTLLFEFPIATQLMERAKARIGHPSFPSDEKDQLRKISVITDALEEARDNDADSVVIINSTENGRVAYTVEQAIFAVVAHLHLSRELAEYWLTKLRKEPPRDFNE